jgi:hypothetical protein
MLDIIITSRTRRKLMTALWRDKEEGTASELSRICRASFSGVHSELESLKGAGLLEVAYRGNQAIYTANREHEKYGALRVLVGAERSRFDKNQLDRERSQGRKDQRVRLWLKEIGAPLLVSGECHEGLPSLEKIFAEGMHLAHRDATVARVLPVCFWLNRERLDLDRLEVQARRMGETQALGFFLSLTGELAKEKAIVEAGEKLRDKRRKRIRSFFEGTESRYNLALAELNTPEIARRWHYRLNIALESFRTVFERFSLQT